MAFRVICSTHTGRLIQDLADSLEAGPGLPGERIPVLLPSVPLREKVRVELARSLGVAMGVEFLLPGAFFNRVAQKLGAPPLGEDWEPEGLFWRLLPLVLEMAGRPGSLLATLGLGGEADPGIVAGFTRGLADRFDQYQHYRPDMIRAWDLGRAWKALPEGGKEAEAWQLELWRRIQAAPGGTPNLVQRFDALKESLRAAVPPFDRPLEVLSTGPFPKSTLELLSLLGQRGGVNLRLLVPSREHISYLVSAKAQRGQGRAADPDVEGNPLLASLGVQARDHFRILEGLLLNEEHFEWLDPDTEPADSLLRRLQEDIRSARQPQAPPGPLDLVQDRSLRVHRCHGAQREIEVLRDEIVRAFEELDGLQAEEVLVLSPNLETHGPLAAALFPAKGYGLPLGLSETRVSLGDPLLAALHALLRFAEGRAPLSEGLAFLENDACQKVLGEEAAGLATRLERSGVTFGLDAGHRGRLGAGGGSSGTWRSGLERLAEGLWFGMAEAPEHPVDKEPCLPLADALSSGRGAGLEALRWFGRLLGTAEAWGAPTDPGLWAERLGQAAQELFPHPDLGREALAQVQASLRRAASDYGCADLSLPARVVAERLEGLAQSDERRVRRVGGRIGFGGLKPLRALPCRVLALVGLDDPSFPRRAGAPAWDLMALKPEPGDRDPRQEDRQLFLDAVLSAGERVIITAPVRHLVSNKDLPFSVCVEELLRAAAVTAASNSDGQAGAAKALVLDHPLQPYARDNFRVHGSYDRAAREIGLAVEAGGALVPFSAPDLLLPGKSAVETPDLGGMDLGELLRALQSPAKAWLQSLGIRTLAEAESGSPDEDLLEAGSGLAGWTALDRELKRALKGGRAGDARALAALRADRLLPYGPLGDAQERCRLAPARDLVRDLVDEGGVRRERVHVPEAGGVWADLEVDASGRSLVLVNAGRVDDPKHLLRAWGLACVDAMAGRSRPLRRFGMSGGGGDKRPHADVLPPPDPGRAGKALFLWLDLARRSGRELLPLDPDWSHERAGLLRRGGAPALTAEAWETAFYAKRTGQTGEPSRNNGDGDNDFSLAWRDRNPWRDGEGPSWDRLALELWEPILEWRERAVEAARA